MLDNIIPKIYQKLKSSHLGKNADYIPELKKVNPNLYAISIYNIKEKTVYNIGDYTTLFALESCSKVFSLALALQTYGIPLLKNKIGEEKTRIKFNSIEELLKNKTHTLNSFNNGGAIATTSLLYTKNKTKKQFEQRLINNMRDFAGGKKLYVNNKIYTSEIQNADHNLAMAYLLNSYKMFYADVPQTVDVYTKQCSVMVTSQDLALMAATFANDGKNPQTLKQVVEVKYIPYILKHMSEHGMYEESDDFKVQIGFPTKSGVSGALMVVIPGVMGIGIYSPRLNKHGNSDRGIKTMKLLCKYL